MSAVTHALPMYTPDQLMALADMTGRLITLACATGEEEDDALAQSKIVAAISAMTRAAENNALPDMNTLKRFFERTLFKMYHRELIDNAASTMLAICLCKHGNPEYEGFTPFAIKCWKNCAEFHPLGYLPMSAVTLLWLNSELGNSLELPIARVRMTLDNAHLAPIMAAESFQSMYAKLVNDPSVDEECMRTLTKFKIGIDFWKILE